MCCQLLAPKVMLSLYNHHACCLVRCRMVRENEVEAWNLPLGVVSRESCRVLLSISLHRISVCSTSLRCTNGGHKTLAAVPGHFGDGTQPQLASAAHHPCSEAKSHPPPHICPACPLISGQN